jgi:ketosteroid isomerase-like protein
MNTLEHIKILEQDLLKAMLHSDLQKLDELIADDLIFTDHNGQLFTKALDLDAHRSGAFKIDSLEPEQQAIRLYGDTAVVSVLLRIRGKYLGNDFEGSNRYTRFWVKKDGVWKIAAGHSSMLN